MTEHNRRQFLAATGVLASTALAGCTNVLSEGSETTTEEMNDIGTTEDMGGMETTEGTDGMVTTEGMETTEGMGGTETTEEGMMATEFEVTVENVSTAETLQTMEGSAAVPLSPLAYAVHGGDAALFAEGDPASGGLEMLAEDGDPETLAEEVGMDASAADAVAVPDGAEEAHPIGPGESYSFTVEAHDGQRLSLATMFVQSNDLFYAPAPEGLHLFDDGDPVNGDVTGEFTLWDAGVEVNEEPGAGPNQAPRQDGPDTGEDEDAAVRRVADAMGDYDYPEVESVLAVTVSPAGMDG